MYRCILFADFTFSYLRGAGLDSAWLHSWPSQGVEGAGPSTAIRTVCLGRVQMMMMMKHHFELIEK